MRALLARDRYLELLTASDASPGLLPPWTAWKAFKQFIREPIEDAIDDAAVIFGRYTDEDGVDRAHVYCVREISERTDEDAAAESALHVVADIALDGPVRVPETPTEHWTQDVPTMQQFTDRVEADAGFQSLLTADARASAVYLEEA